MKKANAPSKIKWLWIVLLLLVVLAAAGYGAYYFYFVPENQGQLIEGILGLVYTNYVQILVSLAAIIIMSFVAGMILSNHKEEKKSLRFLTVLICLIPAFLVVFFLLKEPLMDVASIQNPRTVLLSNVVLEKTKGEYDISGTDQDGHIRTYRINEDRWKTLYEKWDEKEDVFAQVKIFPNTQIVHSVKVEEYLSQSAIDKLAMTNRLSDAWQDMQIQIDNQVYTLQEPLSSLTQSGWSIQQTEYEAQKRANLEAGKSLELNLENKNGMQMLVTVTNTTDQTMETNQATITKIVVHRMNSGMHMMLAGKIVLGWSHQDTVKELYGEPTSSKEDQLQYQEENKTLNLTLSDQGVLEEIEMSVK